MRDTIHYIVQNFEGILANPILFVSDIIASRGEDRRKTIYTLQSRFIGAPQLYSVRGNTTQAYREKDVQCRSLITTKETLGGGE